MPTVKWSPSGNELAIGYSVKDKAQTDILTLATGNFRPLSSGIVSDWSPDGHWVLTSGTGAFLVSTSPQPISVVNVATGQSTPISEGTSARWQP